MLNVDTDATCVQLLAFEESEEEFVAEQLAPASTKMRARHAIASSKDGGPNADILVLIWWKICRRDSLACYCYRGRHPLHCHRADRTEFEREWSQVEACSFLQQGRGQKHFPSSLGRSRNMNDCVFLLID